MTAREHREAEKLKAEIDQLDTIAATPTQAPKIILRRKKKEKEV